VGGYKCFGKLFLVVVVVVVVVVVAVFAVVVVVVVVIVVVFQLSKIPNAVNRHERKLWNCITLNSTILTKTSFIPASHIITFLN
jgi:hypothetical protein